MVGDTSAVRGKSAHWCFPGRDWIVFRLAMNSKGGLPVPGEAPFVYYMMLFGARLGCIPSADKKDACPFLERPHSCTI